MPGMVLVVVGRMVLAPVVEVVAEDEEGIEALVLEPNPEPDAEPELAPGTGTEPMPRSEAAVLEVVVLVAIAG